MKFIPLSSWPTPHYWCMPSRSLLLFSPFISHTTFPFPSSSCATAVLHLMSAFLPYVCFYKMFTVLLHVFLMYVSGIVFYNLISFLSSLNTLFLRFIYGAVFKSNLLLLIAAWCSIQILFVCKNELFSRKSTIWTLER